MSVLKNKIDFVVLVSVTMANSNGDPLNGNRPRTDYNGYGEISDVCIKRKIRNRMQDLGQKIFVQSDDRCDDGFGSLSERASATMKKSRTGRSMRGSPVKPGWMCAPLDRCLPSRTPRASLWAFAARCPSIRR